jgi:cell wall-associated NlpC family hydrolase
MLAVRIWHGPALALVMVAATTSTTPSVCASQPAAASSTNIVQVATDIMNGKTEPGWRGGPVPYSWAGGHGDKPGPSYGSCDGYTGSIHPCPASHTVGTDCSGFSRWVYALAHNRDVLGAGNTDNQLARMHKVDTPVPGDLVFFGYWSRRYQRYYTHHVGVFIGNDKMIDANHTGSNVRQDSINANDRIGYWRY